MKLAKYSIFSSTYLDSTYLHHIFFNSFVKNLRCLKPKTYLSNILRAFKARIYIQNYENLVA